VHGKRSRQIRLAIWGLRPAWMADPKARGLTNARAETIDEKRSFRKPFERRRCIVPADGFYEWFAADADDGKKAVKQPYFFRPADHGVLGMAGLADYWRDPDTETWIPTYTIITTTATNDAGLVHDRMPMIVTADRWDDWLDPTLTSPADARALMAPPRKGSLDIYPVSTAVNTVKNNGPGLLERIDLAA
jgi:putative SOS response-associated peptidase YedK